MGEEEVEARREGLSAAFLREGAKRVTSSPRSEAEQTEYSHWELGCQDGSTFKAWLRSSAPSAVLGSAAKIGRAHV